ncbi:MAG: succinate dehydrogenase/fumarate reductase iron-sulfur subunit [Synechococcales cyanobacterium]
MQVEFRIIRQLPPAPPTVQSYHLDIDPKLTILDGILRLKAEQDGTLAFRKNCRNMICGSCAMRVNGQAGLACQQHIEEALQDGVITLAPLGNLPVVKDLVVDMADFWDNLERVDPFVSPASRQLPEREFRQLPAQRDPLNAASNCILCGACYSDCQSRAANPQFVGPHALAKANRLIKDNRDGQGKRRVRFLNSGSGVWGCTRCQNCAVVCPMGVEPLEQITQIKQDILASYRFSRNPVVKASRAVRHRLLLVALVRQGGWIDERRFGVEVMANQGRDLPGLLGLAPLGIRLLRRGKFPLRFEASTGTATVQKLIDLVRASQTEETGAAGSLEANAGAEESVDN